LIVTSGMAASLARSWDGFVIRPIAYFIVIRAP
jgi:hypothetical protein